jgi:hypothetical protein
VRFLVIGPAPSCRVAGRFVLAGHRGLNRIAFRGRVRGRLLSPGTYTIVPQPVAGSSRLAKAVAVAIDARGIRPAAPVRWRNCNSVVGATAGNALPASATRRSGLAAAEAIAQEKREGAAEKRPSVASSLQPASSEKSSLLAALLLALLAVSIGLLSIAWVEPGDTTMRLRAAQVIVRHRVEIARLGGALLVSTVLLFLLTQL